jgi:hypothetical protein
VSASIARTKSARVTANDGKEGPPSRAARVSTVIKTIEATQKHESGTPIRRSAVYDFVELNRTFHELSRYAQKSDDFDISEAFHVGSILTWAELLKNYRTVILSEAGSGKTEEIRATARKLRAEGKSSFFLRLEHVAEDFDAAFEVGSLDEFNIWLVSDKEAWLLLDSVDEARLRDPRDFDLAVRKLASRVKSATQRVHIILTGRAHAWRPVSRRNIEALLFRNQYGVDVIVPTTRPLLPWLAILDEPIRERLRKIAPEVVFEGGDPSALPLPTRRIILAEVCEQIANNMVGLSNPYACPLTLRCGSANTIEIEKSP